MAEARIVVQDRDNYGEVLGTLTVKDEGVNYASDVFEEVSDIFQKYKDRLEDSWTVEGFIDELKNQKALVVEYDTDVFSMCI